MCKYCLQPSQYKVQAESSNNGCVCGGGVCVGLYMSEYDRQPECMASSLFETWHLIVQGSIARLTGPQLLRISYLCLVPCHRNSRITSQCYHIWLYELNLGSHSWKQVLYLLRHLSNPKHHQLLSCIEDTTSPWVSISLSSIRPGKYAM